MITLQNASLQRGTKQLLSNTNLTLHAGQKAGVVGANGSGKSSLFLLLLNKLHTDSGDCFVPKQWKIAHMAQEVTATGRSALDYVIDGDQDLRRIEQAINSQQYEGEKLAGLYEQMENRGGYTANTRAQQLLNGLGFATTDMTKPAKDFSGGWRIRLNLAQALMCPSDLLLLDEPTNHLDLDTTLWLEQWLKHYPGTLLIISHDRDFLDNTVERIISFENQALISYSGNYSTFEQQQADRLAQQQSAYARQQQRIAEIDRFVQRFKAKASKARQAQSRLKELERMEKIAPAHINSPFNFTIPQAEKISNPLLSLTHANLGYSDSAIINDMNLSILPDSRIGLLGQNGAGKSTLIKTLSGKLAIQKGYQTQGEHLSIGYFAQHQLEALDLNASAAQHLQRLSPDATEQAIRDYLGSFGFQGDRSFEVISHFSGGEKARLALAIVTWKKPNLLLLDEPTNHLDLEMRHALTLALQKFEGAVIIVSHDRHLLRNTVDEFLLVHDGAVSNFDGDLKDYEVWLSQQKSEGNPQVLTASGPSLKKDKREQRQAAAAKREQLKPLRNTLKKLEKTIESLTNELESLDIRLSNPDLYEGNNQELQPLLKKQGALRQELAETEEHWLETSEQLEQLSS